MTTGHYICKVKRKIHKQDIIQSGYDLFYDKGYGVTGISEITERIGIPKGSFYNHFKSKEEFGIAVLDYYMSGNKEFLKESLLNDKYTALENLKKFYNDFIEMQESVLHCSKGCLMGNMTMELADVNETFQKRAQEGFESTAAIFEACLQKAKEQKEISENTDVHLMANFVINAWQGAALRMKADKTTDALRETYKVIFEKLLL